MKIFLIFLAVLHLTMSSCPSSMQFAITKAIAQYQSCDAVKLLRNDFPSEQFQCFEAEEKLWYYLLYKPFEDCQVNVRIQRKNLILNIIIWRIKSTSGLLQSSGRGISFNSMMGAFQLQHEQHEAQKQMFDCSEDIKDTMFVRWKGCTMNSFEEKCKCVEKVLSEEFKEINFQCLALYDYTRNWSLNCNTMCIKGIRETSYSWIGAVIGNKK